MQLLHNTNLHIFKENQARYSPPNFLCDIYFAYDAKVYLSRAIDES